MTTGRYDDGVAVRREVLGDSYVERASADTTDFCVAQPVLDERERRDDSP